MAEKKKRVVIAVDGSDQAEKAFHFYVDHLHRPEFEVILFHCSEASNVSVRMSKGDKPPYDQWREIWEQEKKQCEHIRQKFSSLLQSKDIVHTFDAQQASRPGEAIVAAAQQRDATLVVLGSRGLGSLARVLVGSVSTYVLHHAHCPVLVHQRDATGNP